MLFSGCGVVERARERQRARFARGGSRVRGREHVVGGRRRREERIGVLHDLVDPRAHDARPARPSGRMAVGGNQSSPHSNGRTTRCGAADVGEPLFPAMKESLRSCGGSSERASIARATRSRSGVAIAMPDDLQADGQARRVVPHGTLIAGWPVRLNGCVQRSIDVAHRLAAAFDRHRGRADRRRLDRQRRQDQRIDTCRARARLRVRSRAGRAARARSLPRGCGGPSRAAGARSACTPRGRRSSVAA